MDDDVNVIFVGLFSLLCLMAGLALISLKIQHGWDDSWWFVIVLVFIPAVPLVFLAILGTLRLLWEMFCCWLKCMRDL